MYPSINCRKRQASSFRETISSTGRYCSSSHAFKVVDQLLQRATRLQRKLDLIQVMKSAVTFSDVVGEGESRSAHLARQPELFDIWHPLGHAIHGLPKFPRQLIYF